MTLRLLSLLVLVLAADAAVGKLCGDDVDGRDVACACGDIVVSDLVLDDDPVTAEVCGGDGLVIRAAGTATTTVNLAGKTLRGRGNGQGILVIHGGDGGARVTSVPGRATIEGFDSGIVASGADLQLVENVLIRDVKHDGIRARASELLVRACEVLRAGRDGFAFSGRNYRSVGNRSVASGRHGFMLMGQGGVLTASNQALDCGGAGFLVTGSGHQLEGCVASNNGKNGVELVASNVGLGGCVAAGNGGSGIEGHGSGWRLTDNDATRNREHGIRARGPGMVDAGGNRGTGNGKGLDQGAVQCVIGGNPCSEGANP